MLERYAAFPGISSAGKDASRIDSWFMLFSLGLAWSSARNSAVDCVSSRVTPP